MPGRQPAVSALISCEHASPAVPANWRHLFVGHEPLLHGHRGHDAGALDLARSLADQLQAPLLAGRVTRLLVDLNRSAAHPRHFSEFTRPLPPEQRQRIDAAFWEPHWRAYRRLLESLPGCVVHLACHSFTPELAGRVRDADIGLLYDPARDSERSWCRLLAGQVQRRLPSLRLRMNYPYRGTSNGMGQQHRKLFDQRRLISVELEINQRLVTGGDWPGTVQNLVQAVEAALAVLRKDPVSPASA